MSALTISERSSRLAVDRRARGFAFLKYALLTLFAVPWVGVPLWMLLVNSFKPVGEASQLSLALPEHWAISENYTAVFVTGNYLTGLKNSLLVAVPTIIVVLFLGSLASWAYARSTSKVTQVFFYMTALSILLPPAIIPTIYVLSSLHLDGSILGYALMQMGTRIGGVIFLTTGFVRGLPNDLEEAASIDGASRMRIYFSVLLPLLRPILFVGAVLLVISVWNDFFFGLLLLRGGDSATLPLTMYSFASSGEHGLNWNLVFAHVVMTSLPLVVAYLFAQRQVLAGLTEGSLKG